MSNMAVQMNYGEPSRGMPGLLYDRANYDAVTRRNSAEDGKLFFGCGVVQGAEPGKDITLPATGATAEKFEGVVMYSANTEMDDDGAVLLRKGQILDVCQTGKMWVQLADQAEPAYGQPVYLQASSPRPRAPIWRSRPASSVRPRTALHPPSSQSRSKEVQYG